MLWIILAKQSANLNWLILSIRIVYQILNPYHFCLLCHSCWLFTCNITWCGVTDILGVDIVFVEEVVYSIQARQCLHEVGHYVWQGVEWPRHHIQDSQGTEGGLGCQRMVFINVYVRSKWDNGHLKDNNKTCYHQERMNNIMAIWYIAYWQRCIIGSLTTQI